MSTREQSFESIQSREATWFLPVVNRLPVAIVEGRGSRVTDVAGREYADLTGGWGVTAIGHCHPRLADAVADQARRLMQTTNIFYTLPQLDLAEKLATITPDEITRSFFVSSGAESVDGALKLAHRATGRTQFVSAHGSFHGRTLGGLSVIGQEKHRGHYSPLLRPHDFVPFGDADALREAVNEDTAGVIVEPIQGEGGVNLPPDGYLTALREITREKGTLLICDEVQTGIGRTGRWLAVDHEGVTPDVVTLGKGLGGGFPIAAFLCTEAVAKTVQAGDHGGTYAGNPMGCAAANAVLSVIEEDGLVARSAELGAKVLERFRTFAAEHPDVARGARGRGLLVALELVDEDRAAELPKRAIAAGVLVNVTSGNALRLFPALNIPEDELWPAIETVLELVKR
jgi:acetylornithine/N-succinyldiaminopimelate aminotransferase